jgi:hypothetical protein
MVEQLTPGKRLHENDVLNRVAQFIERQVHEKSTSEAIRSSRTALAVESA